MKIHIVFLKTILTIITYSLIYSVFSTLKIDFVTFENRLNEFNSIRMLSLFFLLTIYLLFSMYLIVWLLYIYI
jgi:hypothetical protein